MLLELMNIKVNGNMGYRMVMGLRSWRTILPLTEGSLTENGMEKGNLLYKLLKMISLSILETFLMDRCKVKAKS
jgi:hypothetical protein